MPKERNDYTNMIIGVFSDIHGNHTAFEACLKNALKMNVDTFIFLGDYLGEFPYPQKTMELLYSVKNKYKCFFVRGNKEDYWIDKKNGNTFEWRKGTSSTGALQYCYSHLKDRDFEFFGNLPVSSEIRFEGSEPLLACHGSPGSANEKMLPDNENTNSIIKGCMQKYILCGHTHIQQIIKYDNKTVLNPGAVGSALHSGGKAQFMILYSKGPEWRHEFFSVDYNKETVLKEIQESGLLKYAPYWTKVTINMIFNGEISHGTVLAKAIEYCKRETGDCIWHDIPEKYWEQAVKELGIVK